MNSKNNKKVEAAKHLKAELDRVLNSENHRWYLGKMSEKDKKERARRAAEFQKRYK